MSQSSFIRKLKKSTRLDWKCVERDIRTVAEIIWKNGGKERCTICPIVKKMENDIEKLEEEIKRLNGTIEWMHNLI